MREKKTYTDEFKKNAVELALELEKKTYTDEFKKNAVELALELENITKAARQLGMSDQTLYKWVTNTQGYVPKKKNHTTYSDSFKQHAVELAMKLGNVAEAARQLGMPDQTLYKWVTNTQDYVRKKERTTYSEGFKQKDTSLLKNPTNKPREFRPSNESCTWLARVRIGEIDLAENTERKTLSSLHEELIRLQEEISKVQNSIESSVEQVNLADILS